MVAEPLAGRREILVRNRHTRPDRAEVVAHLVEDMYPDAEKVTLVRDNLSAHKKSAFYELSEPERARNIVRKLEGLTSQRSNSVC